MGEGVIREGLSVEEVMFEVRPEACKDIGSEGEKRIWVKKTQKGMKL